jgi:GT2 family glycosyltransferase
MPVHNAGRFLDAAIESILAQTFDDFEFVILDDGSDDGSGERLREWAARDRRIRLIGDGRRRGPAGSSNLVTRAARAPLVARMDADDVARPHRLARQLDLLRRQPSVVLIGGLFTLTDEAGRRVRDAPFYRRGTGPLRPPFCHPSILFRATAFQAIGGYRPACDGWEDLDLYLRLATQGEVLVVPEVLIDVRLSGGTTRFRDGDRRFRAAADLMFQCMERYRRVGSYDDMLEAGPIAPHRPAPAVFVSSGATTLWRGRRPGVLWPMLRESRFEPRLGSLIALAWAIWAEVSPRSLRFALQSLLKLRNRLARQPLADHYVWRPAAPLARAAPARSIAAAPPATNVARLP